MEKRENKGKLDRILKKKKNGAIERKVIKEKKRKNFRNFASSLNRFTNLKYVWNKINVLKKQRKYKKLEQMEKGENGEDNKRRNRETSLSLNYNKEKGKRYNR